jgi:hypothetical protein
MKKHYILWALATIGGSCAIMWAIESAVDSFATPVDIVNAVGFQEKKFVVQFQDIIVSVINPTIQSAAPLDYPVITGSHITIILSDREEIIGTPQCHWDGISDKNRWSYTIYFRLYSSSSKSISARQINLRDFTAVSKDDSGLVFTRMGVSPQDGIVSFCTETVKGTVGSNPRDAR